jgi:predicted phage baseplate assembly protein
MTFDFLPNLPKANLDDRHYEDLVEECLQRIPRYCPEWTHYNPSDPGITLVELFAWLTDQMLARLNQVPRRQYIAFLELLGVRLQPPTPAQAELTFYLSTALAQRYTIPAGIEVATDRTPTETAIVFTTDQPLVIGQPQIRHLLTAMRADDQPRAVRDRLANLWSQGPDGAWGGPELSLFDDRPRAGNCGVAESRDEPWRNWDIVELEVVK